MRALISVVVAASTVAGCAHDVHTRYPATPGEPTGVIELVFSDAASSVSVAVNGQLLVRGAHTEQVTIADVPTGFAELAIAAGPGEKQMRVWVDSERKTSIPLPSPGEGAGSAWRNFALSIASVVVYALVRR